MWTLRQIISFIRFALPHAIRLVLSSIGRAFWIVAVTIVSMFKGLAVVNEIAEHWLEEALAHGFPSIWERHLRSFFRFLAGATIVTGWTIILFTSYITANYAYQLITTR